MLEIQQTIVWDVYFRVLKALLSDRVCFLTACYQTALYVMLLYSLQTVVLIKPC
jgi:hypothetical protein